MVTLQGGTLRRALRVATADAPYASTVDRMETLIDLLDWLIARLDAPAEATLRELEVKLGYTNYLLTSSGFPETGAAKVANVTAAIAYARDKGSLQAFLDHLVELATLQSASSRLHQEMAVELTTIHRAKGREWPVVFVPDCNDGFIPFGESYRRRAPPLLRCADPRSRIFASLRAGADAALPVSGRGTVPDGAGRLRPPGRGVGD
jgi:DNA helicase-2/ATP-dependent DNA helicase PcrA